ncbi:MULTISPECIES: ATP-binding protein [Roseomonadaceae]|uniref:ATP-binding protein n=1 Tax=Falsiroseomonas oleicola TaxID=2801474 RepID=A0ABS6H9D9_9PROT|nr:ATP-binding protein [Roseomonas oleicola]MBU8545299.1 ATP-binding protein [Roseomonas oleicola]
MVLRLEVPVSLAGLAAAQEAVEAWAESQDVPPAQALRLRLVTEELLANLIEHATWPAGPTPARLEVVWRDGVLSLALEDAAAPFDPRHAPAAVPSLEGEAVGGLGLALVRRMAQRLDYGRTEAGGNRTSLDIRA